MTPTNHQERTRTNIRTGPHRRSLRATGRVHNGRMNRREEIREKLSRIRAFLPTHEVTGLLLSRRDHFSWLLAGAQNAVIEHADRGLAALYTDGEKIEIVCDNIEAPRIAAEEIAGVPEISIGSRDWFFSAQSDLEWARGRFSGKIAADAPIDGAVPLPPAFDDLKSPLLPSEIERYRDLGRRASYVLESAAWQAEPGMTEFEIAGLTDAACRAHGIEAVVNLVAVDERIAAFRHPVPTMKKAERRAMLVLCARKDGLIAALTRLVFWDDPDADLLRRHAAVVAVDVALNAATRPGKTADEILRAGQAAYAAHGFDGEWKKHHQGGGIGYAPRTFIARPGGKEIVRENCAYAWNPSITGTKSEDTVLVGKSGLEFLTAPGDGWPIVTVEHGGVVWRRPGILVR